MNALEQENEFRGWKVLPARLDVFQTAWFLGFKPHDIPVLTAAGLLKPLGHPARNCIKHYATETLDALRQDEKWLARASDAICNYWRERNAAKELAGAEQRETRGSTNRLAAALRVPLRQRRWQFDDAVVCRLLLVTFQ